MISNGSAYEKAFTELESYKQINEMLDAIIESSFDGIWVCDHEGRVVRVNSASAKMDGVDTNHFIGQKMEDLVRQGFIDRSVTLEVLKKKTTVTLLQNTRAGKQVLVTGNPVFDDNGQTKLVVVNERDYTVLNQLRQELEESKALAREYRSELSQIQSNDDLKKQLVIRSKTMERAFDRAVRVSQVDSTVLVKGQSGVGKSMISKLIHQLSGRRRGPFIRVDCGAIPESLIESEIFGYEKGAFTGASTTGKPGLFELADTGTLFLDEVGELPLSAQVKLLRFLEEGEMTRVGGTASRTIDVRVIAATNQNLSQMVQQQRFRKDLFFRLSVVPLNIPPLVNRPDDIPALIRHFIEHFNQKYSIRKAIGSQAVDCLCRYPFPGNIRELANLVERLIVLAPQAKIEFEDLPAHVRLSEKESASWPGEESLDLKKSIQQLEKIMIVRALDSYKTQVVAARRLGIDQATLSRKMKRYKINEYVKIHNI